MNCIVGLRQCLDILPIGMLLCNMDTIVIAKGKNHNESEPFATLCLLVASGENKCSHKGDVLLPGVPYSTCTID